MATQCGEVDTYGEIGTVLGVVIVKKAAADAHTQVDEHVDHEQDQHVPVTREAQDGHTHVSVCTTHDTRHARTKKGAQKCTC